MARQYRVNSFEIYDKLGMKKIDYRKKSKFIKNTLLPQTITIGEGFYITQPSTKRYSSVESVKPSETSWIDFDKQLPRPDIYKTAPDVHENRFIAFNDCPASSTKHKRILTPKFSLYLGRRQKLLMASPENNSESFSPQEKTSRSVIVPFSKTQGRISLERPSTYSHKLVNIDFSKLDSNILTPSIEKSSSRRNKSNLPLFMVNFINRGKNISLKSLQMNSYMESQYMPLTSTFGKGWKQESKTFPIPIKGRCPKIVKVLRQKLKMG
jgi:hypothetical protein